MTKRESEILRLIAAGFKNKEIAEKLFISYHTVRTHRANIVEALHAKNIINAEERDGWRRIKSNSTAPATSKISNDKYQMIANPDKVGAGKF